MKPRSKNTGSKIMRRVMSAAAILTAVGTAGNDAFACTQYYLYNVGRYERISGRVTLLYSVLNETDKRQVCMDVTEVVETLPRRTDPHPDDCGCLELPASHVDSGLLGKFVTMRSGGALSVSQ